MRVSAVTGTVAGIAAGLLANAAVAAAAPHAGAPSGATGSRASYVAPSPGEDRGYDIGLWGDLPYAKAGDAARLPALLADLNANRLAFTVFDGDIKDGSSRCTDDVYSAAAGYFDQLRAPAVYVPGDNEWTDCHRINNGGFNNLERLDHIRKVMFARPDSFGQRTMRLVHQGAPTQAYSENTMWTKGGVVYVGLNVPGSNNNKVNTDADCTSKSVRTPADCAADNAEYVERSAKNMQWLAAAFELARTRNLAGVMVVIQADPGFDLPETENTDERTNPPEAKTDGYTALLEALVTRTRAFPGQVMLVHGDTHFFKLDKPLVDQAHLVPNFTRLETFGSPNDDWVKVHVDAESANVFSVVPMIVPSA